jgi:hypothetical protein
MDHRGAMVSEVFANHRAGSKSGELDNFNAFEGFHGKSVVSSQWSVARIQ